MIETAAATTDVDLIAELRELRQTVATLQAALARRHRIILHAERPQPFLGQPVKLVARVTDATGTPRAGVPVIFSTTWGRLETGDGYALRQGASLTARTYPDGTARVTLLPRAAEDLTSAQQDSLIAMLARLDPQAAKPQEIAESLAGLVEQYRWKANRLFRQAVDVLFREFRDELVDTVNRRDLLGGWRYFEATVFAHVPGVEDGSAVDATAAVSLRFKDWLGPWLETHLRLSPAENALVQELERIKKKAGNEAATLLDGIYDRVRRFVDDQEGVVGQLVGQRVAESSIRRFATTAIDDLPRDVRNRLFRSLDVASRTVRTAGVHVLSEVGKARLDANVETDAKIDRLNVGRIDTLRGQMSRIEEEVGRKAEASEVTEFRTAVERRIEDNEKALQTKVDRETFARFEDSIRDSLNNRLSLDRFERYQDETSEKLADKVDRGTFARSEVATRSSLSEKLSTRSFESYKSETSETLADKVDHESLNGLKETIKSNLSSLQNSVRGFQVLNPGAFDPFRRIPR